MSNSNLLLQKREYGLAFVISAPAGTGKTTLVEMLVKEFESAKINISATTRAKRANEVEGVHYQFVSEALFDEKLAKGDFLEHVSNFGHRYGTDKEYIEQVRKSGRHIFLIIDTQGAEILMKRYDAIYVFIMPPTISVLQERLKKRGTETELSMQYRLSRAEDEIRTAKHYDYVVVNDDLARAYQVLRSIFIAETHRVEKLKKET